MCALTTAVVAIAASQASVVGQPGDLGNQIRACRPGEDFEGEYRVIVCKAGVRVVRVELEYELRDADFVLTKSRRVKRGLGGS